MCCLCWEVLCTAVLSRINKNYFELKRADALVLEWNTGKAFNVTEQKTVKDCFIPFVSLTQHHTFKYDITVVQLFIVPLSYAVDIVETEGYFLDTY